MSRRSLAVCSMLAVVASVLAPAGAIAVTPPWDPFFAAPATIADFGTATRPFGVAAGDFDGDGEADLVVGRTTGNVAFVKGNGDGTFQAPVVYAWKQAFFNAWAFASGDLNGDGNLDVVWGANVDSGTGPVVRDGEVRVFYGNGDGTFQQDDYFVSGVLHNAGSLLADIGTDAGSLAAGDIDGDGDVDVVAGAVDGANSVVKVLRNGGSTPFTQETLVSQPTNVSGDGASPTYFPAISTQNSPWGLAFGDADGDGDLDLFVGDRALYVYLYINGGAGNFTLKTPNGVLASRPNVYLRHDTFRAAVGFTASFAAADVNGDGKADLFVGLHSGTQTPATNTANDGLVMLNVSTSSGHTAFGPLADLGTMTRGLATADVNGDGATDLIGAVYEGQVKLMRQLPPLDTDGDGVSDYVDNAPEHPNAARLDMNTDGSITYRDQLDNDFDTVLGDPEDPSTWQRLGDPADPDDDNDGVSDTVDNCHWVPNPDQADADGDGRGDACDALDDRDTDGDGVPDGPLPGDPLYEEHLAAAQKWASASTKFVLRNDALSRFFQNEFTQLMTDAAVLGPEEWAGKCWENYDPGDAPSIGTPDPTYEPCGTGEGTADQTLTLPGGVGVSMSLVVIGKQIWTDPPVVDWMNDRFQNPLLEIGQHGTYHPNNTPLGDATHSFACETCGFTEGEMFQLLKVGLDSLTGKYDNKWVAESGATASSPRIDWSLAANPLISYAAPFNTSDATSREAMAQLGFKAFSASRFEEDPNTSYGSNFADNPSSMEKFGPSGMFHVSADSQVDPPHFDDDNYSAAERQAYHDFLVSRTEVGGLNTWLIEEVEWSGRLCNNQPRLSGGQLTDCNGQPNRENNTVYLPRWDAWIQLLEYVRDYPDSVVMTMGEVALAHAFDNAPTVANPEQADSDHDGVGDVIDGAQLSAADATFSRNQDGDLSATLTNGADDPIVGQEVTFSFDSDGDGTDESYVGITDSTGLATVTVTPTAPVGPASFSVEWDGLRAQASDGADVTIVDATALTLDANNNPTSGQVTDAVTVGASLVDSDGVGVAGQTVTFTIGTASATGTTDADGHASATLTLEGPAGSFGLTATFDGTTLYGSSSVSADFTVLHEDTTLVLADAVATAMSPAVAEATLTEADGQALAGKVVEFLIEQRKGRDLVFVSLGTAVTDADGVARFEVETRLVSSQERPIRAIFQGDESFLASADDAVVYRRR